MTAKPLLYATLAAALAGPAAYAQDVGVTAAVNPDAHSRMEGEGAQIVEMGQNVLHNQIFDTDAAGIVQILLADGTNFTVGPNSSLKIDSFVYDPNADTATVAASASRGMFRFIGGASTKRGNQAEIKTPVGVAGIRGAIVDFNLTPSDGQPPSISLVYGDELVLVLPDGTRLVLTLPGTSISFAGGTPSIIWTPDDWAEMHSRILNNGSHEALRGPQAALEAALEGAAIGDVPLPPPSGSGRATAREDDPEIFLPPPGDQAREDALLAEIENHLISTPTTPTTPTGPTTPTTPTTPTGPTFPTIPTIPTVPTIPTIPSEARTLNGTYLGFSSGVVTNELGGRMTPSGRAELRFNANEGTVSGQIGVGAWGDARWELSEAEGTYTSDRQFEGTNHSGEMRVAQDPSQLCDCEFLTWGTWSAATPNVPSSAHGYPLSDGYWIVGDINTPDQLPINGTATYSGQAMGMVSTGDQLYSATGALNATVDFGSGTGNVQISDFDGRTFGTGDFDMRGNTRPDGIFQTEMSGDGAFGLVSGGLVSSDTGPAGGIAGNFDLYDWNADWSASGIYGGARTP